MRGNGHEACIRFERVGVLQEPGDALADRQGASATMCQLQQRLFGAPIQQVLAAVHVANGVERRVGNSHAIYRLKCVEIGHIRDHEPRFAIAFKSWGKGGCRRQGWMHHKQGTISVADRPPSAKNSASMYPASAGPPSCTSRSTCAGAGLFPRSSPITCCGTLQT